MTSLFRATARVSAAALVVAGAGCSPSPSPTAGSPGDPDLQTRVAAVATRLAMPTEESTRPAANAPTQSVLVSGWPGQWSRGPSAALVSLIVYTDFQCGVCADLASALREVALLHPQEVRVTYRPLPQPDVHDKAGMAAEFAEAAGQRGRFWEVEELLFDTQAEWEELSPDAFLGWIESAAAGVGLDGAEIRSELSEGLHAGPLIAAAKLADQAGLQRAPLLFFNQEIFRASLSAIDLEAAVRLAVLEARRLGSYPAAIIDPSRTYTATLIVGNGEIVVELDAAAAPLAVNNFVYLSRQDWYDGSPVYQVFPGRLVEGGDPSGTGLGGPGYTFPDEIRSDLRFDRPGRVAMASVGPGTNGSRFFISLAPLPELDGTRTIFGQVTRGLQLLESLQARDPIVDLLEPAELVVEDIVILED